MLESLEMFGEEVERSGCDVGRLAATRTRRNVSFLLLSAAQCRRVHVPKADVHLGFDLHAF